MSDPFRKDTDGNIILSANFENDERVNGGPVHDEPKEPRPLTALNLSLLANEKATAKEFVISQLAPQGEVTLFTGAGSAGKSLFAQQMATAGAAGLGCLGYDVAAGPAVYLTCEDDTDQLHWRQEHVCASLGVGMADLDGSLSLITLRGQLDNTLTVKGEGENAEPSPLYERIAATIETSGAKQLWLDNVAHLFAGNENDRGEVTQFVNLLNRLAGETGAAIILLGHPNKAGDDYSGSTAWQNAVRSQFIIDHDIESDVRTIRNPKTNYAKKGQETRFVWMDWAFVLEDDLPPDLAREMQQTIQVTAENKTFLNCLRAVTEQGRQVGPSVGPNYAPTRFAKMTEAKGFTKAKLERSMERLFHTGEIETQEVKRKGNDTKTIIMEVRK